MAAQCVQYLNSRFLLESTGWCADWLTVAADNSKLQNLESRTVQLYAGRGRSQPVADILSDCTVLVYFRTAAAADDPAGTPAWDPLLTADDAGDESLGG